jgi:hypothetical protein
MLEGDVRAVVSARRPFAILVAGNQTQPPQERPVNNAHVQEIARGFGPASRRVARPGGSQGSRFGRIRCRHSPGCCRVGSDTTLTNDGAGLGVRLSSTCARLERDDDLTGR